MNKEALAKWLALGKEHTTAFREKLASVTGPVAKPIWSVDVYNAELA